MVVHAGELHIVVALVGILRPQGKSDYRCPTPAIPDPRGGRLKRPSGRVLEIGAVLAATGRPRRRLGTSPTSHSSPKDPSRFTVVEIRTSRAIQPGPARSFGAHKTVVAHRHRCHRVARRSRPLAVLQHSDLRTADPYTASFLAIDRRVPNPCPNSRRIRPRPATPGRRYPRPPTHAPESEAIW